MIKHLPIIPTILVAAAAAVMVWLGFWQLGRADEKAELIARYSDATTASDIAPFPAGNAEAVWFRQSSVTCLEVQKIQAVAGTGANGQKGWAQRASCSISEDQVALIDLGFSRNLTEVDWVGGRVTGVIAPGPRLVADPPLAGLQPLAKPDPNDLPNNHLAYAGQWFLFALTALVIYWLAVRSRLTKRD